MPEPVSVRDTAAKGPGAGACPRMAGLPTPQARRSVKVPSPSIASRALTDMFTSAVSNWLRSARTKQGESGSSVKTRMRAPVLDELHAPVTVRAGASLALRRVRGLLGRDG